MSGSLLPKKLQIRLLFSIGLGVAFYFGFVLYAGFDDVRHSLASFAGAWWIIPAACSLAMANYLIRFIKWEYYRGLLHIELKRSTSLLIYLSGFVLSVTPGKMGEVFKSYLIKKIDGTSFSRSAPIIVAERFTDLTGYLILLAIGGLSTFAEASWMFWATLILVTALLIVLFSPRLVNFLIGLTHRRTFIWRFTEKLEQAYDSARILLNPKRILLPTLISTVSWGCECLAFYLVLSIFTPLDGHPLPSPLWAIFAYAFSAIAGALVIVMPGGLGVTEGSLGKLLDDKAHFAQGDAAVITLTIRACTLWFAILVGYIALLLFVHHHGKVEVPDGQ